MLENLKNNPLDYWSWLSDTVTSLSKISIKLFSISVNSASCERLFSSMSFLHTKTRNKLKVNVILMGILFILISLYLT
jgi:hypothetical protein